VAPPASARGAEHERAYFGPALLSKTTDFGATWSTPRVIVGGASQDQTIGNQIVINRQTGALYNFFKPHPERLERGWPPRLQRRLRHVDRRGCDLDPPDGSCLHPDRWSV